VKVVRQVLFETTSSFNDDLRNQGEFVDSNLYTCWRFSKFPLNQSEDICKCVALELLNLYRIVRLGHYTLDNVPGVVA
jgi:hypothetical protein